jgi:hypothetical protein
VLRALIRWSAVLLCVLQAVPAGTIRAEKKVRVAINGAWWRRHQRDPTSRQQQQQQQ